MLLSAIAYNLKKLLKHQPKRMESLALALQPVLLGRAKSLFTHCLRGNYLGCSYSLS
jgi:hypothetical protein